MGALREAPSPISFIFMQFSAKIVPNNRLETPPPGNPGSATVLSN